MIPVIAPTWTLRAQIVAAQAFIAGVFGADEDRWFKIHHWLTRRWRRHGRPGALPEECSICHGWHGREIEHPCE